MLASLDFELAKGLEGWSCWKKIEAMRACELKPGFVEISARGREAFVLAGVQVDVAGDADVSG